MSFHIKEQDKKYDVCIVGSGADGLMNHHAEALTHNGLLVILMLLGAAGR